MGEAFAVTEFGAVEGHLVSLPGRHRDRKLAAMTQIGEAQVYAEIGEEGFARLVSGFYVRVRGDDVLSAMYPKEDLAGAEGRLRAFLMQRFGGPAHYSAARGHPRLRMRHAPFRIDQRARDRWVMLMDAALDEAQLPRSVCGVLRPFLHQTATFMINSGSEDQPNSSPIS